MKKAIIIYYSQTGNTEIIAEAIKRSLLLNGLEVSLIQLNNPEDNFDYSSSDLIFLGCPASGVEQLEETIFNPFWQKEKSKLKEKKLILFGSYSWGDGEFIRQWESEAKEIGIKELWTLPIQEAPDADCEKEIIKFVSSIVA